jgi:hypothetical protein
MKYKGKKLLLDNFRSLLKDYSLDIQDVVRSCILDDIDVEKYLSSCRNNPIWLDQIRLAKKEGISDEFLDYGGGKLTILRDLYRNNINLSILRQYNARELSDVKFAYIAKWLKDGIDFRNIDVSLIPEYLLQYFESGLIQGLDMKKLNTDVNYTYPYFEDCTRLLARNLPIDKFIGGEYAIEVLDLMVKLGVLTNNSAYYDIYNVLEPNVTAERVHLYERYRVLGGNLEHISEIKDGNYVITQEMLELFIEAISHGVDLASVYKVGMTYKELNLIYQEALLKGDRKLSGKLRKQYHY